ncbi:SAGA complex subunit Sgf73 [Malassezia sp. CBS 17886]|nr:SAGA complex subunit Sgf73 [Malassezia sp. CBS 17886]
MSAEEGRWEVLLHETRSAPPSPRAVTGKRPWQTNASDVTEFGGAALDDDVDVVACVECGKPVLREAYAYHRANCDLARAIADGRLSPSAVHRSAESSSTEAARGADADGSALKVLALDARRRRGLGGKKNRGPLNLDRQCGVINQKGLPCSRSLTCKSHSMGAKRTVPGRSQPYDVLLFEWQKATNPAFVARLEEKERAIAAGKASASAVRDKKRRAAAERGGARAGDPGDDDHPARGPRGDVVSATDMYAMGASYDAAGKELLSVLNTIHLAASRDRTTILPLATRGFAGQYTLRAKRFRVMRQFLAQGLSGTAHMRARLGDSPDEKARAGAAGGVEGMQL